MLKQLDQIWHPASPERKTELRAAEERGLLSDVTSREISGSPWAELHLPRAVAPLHPCAAQLCQPQMPRGLRAGCPWERRELRVRWGMLASSALILTDFHSNWQIGMSMLEMLCESQGNKSQNVHTRICGTHSICHNVYHHFKTCTRPQLLTSSILELLQLGFAIWSKSQLKSAIIVQIMRSIVRDPISSQLLINSSVL